MALLLYLAVTLSLALFWSRRVQRISVAAAIALIALPLVFTGKAMLTNRVYAPLDLPFTAEPLRDYARELGVETPHNIALSDLHCQIIPWQQAVRHALAEGEWPLWNPFILNGDILAAAAQPAVYDPLQLLGLILSLPDALTFGASMTFFIAAFFTFAFARTLGLKEVAALVAAAGFTFCGMMAFFVGWPLARAWAYLPLVLFGVQRVVVERRPAILTIAFVLLIFAGHPESVLHVVAVGAVYGLVLKPGLRAVGLAIGAGIVALLLTAIYLLPFAEAAPETLEYLIRRELYAPTSYDVIVSPEVRHERIAKTFIPFRHGPTSTPGWDPLTARVGVVILALGALAVFLAPRKAWFWFILAIVCLLATFGMKPVAHALHALPLFDIAINERLAFAAAFAMSILAAITVDRIPRRGFAILLLALVLVERTNEDGDYYPALPKRTFYPRVPLLDAVPRDARVAGVGVALIPNNGTLYNLEDARGYNAMTYRRLYETYPLWSTYQRAYFNRIDDLTRPFLSFLNIRYALTHESNGIPAGWTLRASDRQTRLLENPVAQPRAFVPNAVRYVKENPVEDMKTVADFREIAWIEDRAEGQGTRDEGTPTLGSRPSALGPVVHQPHQIVNGPGSVTMRRVGLEYHLDATMTGPGWIVIAETAWPGWRAYVDGTRHRVHFANHAFLGVHVPKGQHRVRLVYLPDSFTRGRAISGITLLLLAAAGVCYRTRACSRFFSTSRSRAS